MTRDEIQPLVLRLCGDLDPALILAIIEHESSFRESAFRNDRAGGSYGLMQLELQTARDRGFEGAVWGLYDPAVNVDLGIAHMRWIREYLQKHLTGYTDDQWIAAYNEGVGSVCKGHADHLYVEAVKGARARWAAALAKEKADA